MKIRSISTGKLLEKVEKKQKFDLIDVREDFEVAEGMVPGATHIQLNEIPNRLDDLSKDKEYYIICRSGVRSLRVCEFLQDSGFNVMNVSGGMNSWFGEKVFPS
ncbi:MAG: ytwF [Bacillales bacterium]|jgi:rhodanese-related sulfurtransferase|nr:ytwF [Bacillales bacterium]